ncbi:hypothetical protein NKR19_g9496 [Coniochaeta hoffmannii]|uniref:Uncharacterized protein n=1 Tax=Coniochaeta hoffmannii TaxID=91930 RepID=A0AA38RBK4_9PEZI|nr:hypothetical protein NKR19_g9496 [Coniochaeta hoffmannii]
MAFHQPTRPALQRPSRIEVATGNSEDLAQHTYRDIEASQTWVLFSPATDAGTTASYLSSAQESQPTPGRSRLSDGGSVQTAGRSDIVSGQYHIGAHSVFEESLAEEDAELDSLDSHLPDFRSLPSPYSQLSNQQQALSHTIPVLPGHDGLGSFRIDSQPMSSEIQEQLYAFERFNPRRVKRRRESLDLAQVVLEQEDAHDADRNRRIEAWRLEHSQYLLEEIRKETRRRRQSEASMHKLRAEKNTIEDIASMSTVNGASQDIPAGGNAWHDHDIEEASNGQQGFWSRITRKVIQDLMGIDDRLLSILFGEAVPDEADLSSTPKASAMTGNPAGAPYQSESSDDSTWQVHLLERVARELGLLVNHLSSHPGAFSTYAQMQQMPIPYAGLPVIPEMAVDINEAAETKADESVPSMPQFQPSIPRPAQPIAIAGARSAALALDPVQSILVDGGGSSAQTFTQQEWEQDLDIRLVFRYLRSRFTSDRPSSASFTSGTSHLATSSTPDAAAKAARVRQHHPLVSHAHQRGIRAADRRTFKATVPSSPVALRHAPGSCASQSTRRSARRSSISSRHSSRHYWDIGGSMGTGSMIASTGPMGTWGEV